MRYNQRMSADARPPSASDDRAWQPSSLSPNTDRQAAVSGIRTGCRKIIEGGSEAVRSVALLVVLLLLSILGEKGDESTNAQDRTAEWDVRAKPIQERFEKQDVDEQEVSDAILWARSQ